MYIFYNTLSGRPEDDFRNLKKYISYIQVRLKDLKYSLMS